MFPVVGVFAHPDDEAMGPAGTLALFAHSRPVYLICATDDNSGKNLTPVRRIELQKSSVMLGIKEVFFLDFRDGDLSNNLYPQLAAELQVILDRLKPDTLVTYEPRGVSGHIDHMVVSSVCNHLFDRLKYLKFLLSFCLPDSVPRIKNYFVYFPPGYPRDLIDKVVDVKNVWSEKISAIKCHQSQIHDVRRVLAKLALFPKTEHFLLRTK